MENKSHQSVKSHQSINSYQNQNTDKRDINLQVGIHLVSFDQQEYRKHGHSSGLKTYLH